MSARLLREELDLTEASFSSASRKLANVVLIRAGMSLNKRLYSEAVLKAAAPIFEGARAYDGHDWFARKVSEITGWYENVRYENGALFADRVFSQNDAGRNIMAVVEDIVSGNAPKGLAGLSINAMGEGFLKNENDPDTMYFEVTALTSAESVDDVTMPAAGGAYLAAGQEMGEMAAAFLKGLSYEDWQAARPDLVERFKNEWKTARQSDAIKALHAEIATLKDALIQAQTALDSRKQAHEAAEARLTSVRREAAIDVMLAAVPLSGDWKEDLRKALLLANPTDWQGIIEREQRKVESVRSVARPRVSGASQQVSSVQTPAPVLKPGPLPNEDAITWAKRIGLAPNTP